MFILTIVINNNEWNTNLDKRIKGVPTPRRDLYETL